MKGSMVGLALVCLACVLSTSGLANQGVGGDDPAMMVSPQTIVLAKVDSVTVHTNVPASSVVADSLTLAGAPAVSVWADSCGHVACRFDVADLPLTAGESATLTLEGDYVDGGDFTATDTVQVK